MELLCCFLYIAVTGTAFLWIGRALPKKWFRGDAFPFRPLPFEQRLYRKLRVKDWQKKLPDMSRLLPKIMPAKRISPDTLADLPRMIQETCVAELIHVLLSVVGLGCLRIWPGAGGRVFTAGYILLGNLPFILIQRYNRPCLQNLLAMRQRQEKRRTGECER